MLLPGQIVRPQYSFSVCTMIPTHGFLLQDLVLVCVPTQQVCEQPPQDVHDVNSVSNYNYIKCYSKHNICQNVGIVSIPISTGDVSTCQV